jgi:hypothetical protein
MARAARESREGEEPEHGRAHECELTLRPRTRREPAHREPAAGEWSNALVIEWARPLE